MGPSTGVSPGRVLYKSEAALSPLSRQSSNWTGLWVPTSTSLLIIFSATLVILLLGPTQLNPLTLMPPKPKLNVHNFPRPPLLEKTGRHLQVKWHDQTIADTKDAYWVLETTHPPSNLPSLFHVRFMSLTSPSICTYLRSPFFFFWTNFES